MDDIIRWIRSRAMPLATVEPETALDDLEPLRSIIGDARILSLGEATHGTREFFQLKHRLVEFCVERLGFTMFGIEASFPESLRLNDYVLHGTGKPAEALLGMRFWTWNTQEVLALVEWMRAWNEAHERKVKFYGFDMQFPTVAALGLLDYLGRVAPDLATAAAAPLGLLTADFTARLFSAAHGPVRDGAFAWIERILAAFARERAAWVQAAGDREWHLARLHAIVLEQGARADVAEPMESFAIRDRSMAENVRSLLDAEGPGAKAILWSHNLHAQRVPIPGYPKSMGCHLDDFFGHEQVIIGFAFNQGWFQAMSEAGALIDHAVGPAEAGSFDAALAQAGPPLFALDVRSAAVEKPVSDWFATKPLSRFVGATYAPERAAEHLLGLDPRERFDALLFVDSTTAARGLPYDGDGAPAGTERTLAQPSNLELAGDGSIPEGWRDNVQPPCAHAIAMSDDRSPSGGRVLRIASPAAPWRWGDGTLSQDFSAEAWRGKRLRFAAAIRALTEDPGAGAQLVVTVRGKPADGAEGAAGRLIAFATMAERPVRTAQWARHAVECDIPAAAERIVIGFLVTGNATGWFGDVELAAA